jgi:hypothetical protein
MFYVGARSNSPQREVILLIAMRTQNVPLERCAGVQGCCSPNSQFRWRMI